MNETPADAERQRDEAEQQREAAEAERASAEEVRDSWWHRNMGAIVGLLCGAVVALTFLCGYLVTKIDSEGKDRRDQTCRGWEKVHAQEIKDLRRSYGFYTDPNLPPSLKQLVKNPISIAVLRERIRNAKSDLDQFGQFVPPYCDEPNVGVKEPDPKVPKMPAQVKLLLERNKPIQPQPQP